jgi:hypothetical protein
MIAARKSLYLTNLTYVLHPTKYLEEFLVHSWATQSIYKGIRHALNPSYINWWILVPEVGGYGALIWWWTRPGGDE